MLGELNDVLLSVVSAMFWPGREQLPAAVQPLGERSRLVVVNPLVLKLLLFPVKTSTTL